MKKTKNKNKSTIDRNLIQELIRQADGQELFGSEGVFQQLKRGLVNSMLEGEMDHHIGYEKHNKAPDNQENRRNGHYPKTIISGKDTLDLNIPRDREGEFEPQLIPKGDRQFDGFDDKVISMYGRGMTMR